MYDALTFDELSGLFDSLSRQHERYARLAEWSEGGPKYDLACNMLSDLSAMCAEVAIELRNRAFPELAPELERFKNAEDR